MDRVQWREDKTEEVEDLLSDLGFLIRDAKFKIEEIDTMWTWCSHDMSLVDMLLSVCWTMVESAREDV